MEGNPSFSGSMLNLRGVTCISVYPGLILDMVLCCGAAVEWLNREIRGYTSASHVKTYELLGKNV